jgi:LysR family transcriptional regulator for bpeEF and oprC
MIIIIFKKYYIEIQKSVLPMELTTAMQVFGEVARLGSFTAAGHELRLSTASISRIVAELERDLGVRLLNRTTRQLALTDAGAEFLQGSTGILEEIETLRGRTRERQEAPRGRLRISAVTGFGNNCLAPAIPGFLKRYPDLRLTLDIGNRPVDLIEEHYDLAIRVGPLSDSSLIAQKIYQQRMIFVATPEFCAQHGNPKTLEDVRSLPSVMQISGEWGRVHYYRRGRIDHVFEVPQGCVMSSAAAVRKAALTGYGYTIAADFAVADDLAQGRLVKLLPDYEPLAQPIFALYPQRHYLPRKVRIFVDYLLDTFSTNL